MMEAALPVQSSLTEPSNAEGFSFAAQQPRSGVDL
jgi:hypothetical protein